MFIFGNIILALAGIFDWILLLYQFVLIIYCIISWVNPDPYNPVVRLLRSVTEPVLWRVRKILPFTYTKGIDFSPILVLFVIYFIRTGILPSLARIGASMI